MPKQNFRVEIRAPHKFSAEELENAREVVRSMKGETVKACAECGASIPAKSAYCSNCGYPQRQMFELQTEILS